MRRVGTRLDLCFYASPPPCLHTFWHAIPTSFTLLMFFLSCFYAFLVLQFDLNLRRVIFQIYPRTWNSIGSLIVVPSRLFLSIAISLKVNSYMQCLTFSISLGNYYDRASRILPSQHVCTSPTPRPMTVVFVLGTRLLVRMCKTLENGVLRNGQLPGRAETSFIDQGELAATKTLSGCKALRCDTGCFVIKWR